MRYIILLLLCVSGISASAQRISVDFDRKNLAEALIEIENLCNDVKINFVYDDLEDFLVTQHIDNQPLEKTLKIVCGLYPVRISQKNGEYFIECIQKEAVKIKGRIVDEEGLPMAFATIMLLHPKDSICVNSGISDNNGDFIVPCSLEDVIVKVSYVGYETLYTRTNMGNVGLIKMQTKIANLQGINVQGHRRSVNIDGGLLSYDMASLLSSFSSDNVYDALLCVPGFYETNSGMHYGGKNVNIVIDGKVTLVSNEHLVERLKRMPADQLERIEVLLATSPSFYADGLTVNLITRKHVNINQTTAQVRASLQQNRHLYGNMSGNLQWIKGKLAVDAQYSFVYGNTYDRQNIGATNPYQGSTHYDEVTFSKIGINKNTWRATADYAFAENHKIGVAYDGEWQDNHDICSTTGLLSVRLQRVDKHSLHNVDVSYHSPFGLELDVLYLSYRNQYKQLLNNNISLTQMDIAVNSTQNFNQWHIVANQKHQLSKEWQMLYGLKTQYNYNDSHQQTTNMDGALMFDSLKKVGYLEYIVNPYVECSNNIGQNMNFKFCVSTEWYDGGDEIKWNFFPSCNVTWNKNERNSFSVILNCNPVHPNYWSTFGCISYGSRYVETWGNPNIKSYSHYMAELLWHNAHRNSLRLFVDYCPGLILKQPYLLSERMAVIIKDINLDDSFVSGICAMTQYSIGQWFSGNVNLMYSYRRDRLNGYHDLSFNRNKFNFVISGSASVKLFRQHDLSAIVSPSLSSADISGAYDVSPSFMIDTRLQWFSNDKRWGVSLNGINLTNCRQKLTARNGNHNFTISHYVRFPSIMLTATYNIGNYKTTRHKTADISRMKH